MALNIPNVGSPLEALFSGINTGTSAYSRVMQPILHRESLAQQKQSHEAQLAQRMKEHMDNLKIQQMQQARLSQMAPLQQQLAKMQLDKLGMELDPAKKMAYIQSLMQGIHGMGGQQPEQQAPPMQPFGGMGMPSQQEMENPTPMSAPSRESLQQGFGGFSPEQQMALGMAGIKIPRPYESPEQKHQGAIQQAISIDEAKANRKKIDDIEKTAQSLLPYLGKVNTIGDILERKPDLVGRTTKLADMLGMTKDEDIGKFISAAQSLQTHLAKDASARGGYGIMKLVEQAKPNIGKSTAYNKGVVKELRQSMKESFDQMDSEYKRLTGKKLPYDFEQYFKEVTGETTQKTGEQSGNGKRLKFNLATGRLE